MPRTDRPRPTLRCAGAWLGLLPVVFFVVNCDLAFPLHERATTSSNNDGSSEAPGCAIPHQSLLKNYAARPPWNVAGVDYCVGYPASTKLKDPMTIAIPGVSLDTTHFIVSIDSDDVVLDGYDFSMQGGWQVRATNGNSPIIQNSYFKVGTNGNDPIVLFGFANQYTGTGGTVRNCVIDGNSTPTVFNSLLFFSRGGQNTVMYNWFKNASANIVNAGADTGNDVTDYVFEYNVLENDAQVSGLFANWVQTYPSSTYDSIAFDHNTIIQTLVPANETTQGVTFDGNGRSPFATFETGTFSFNTVVVTSSPVGAVQFVVRVDPTLTSSGWTLASNYVDPSGVESAGAGGPVFQQAKAGGPDHGTVTQSNNVDMVTGGPVP